MIFAGSTSIAWFALLLPAVSVGYLLGRRSARAGAAASRVGGAHAQDSAEPPRPMRAPQARRDETGPDAEHRWTALVANHPGISVLISDRSHRILWANATFTELTGYTAAEAKGRPVGELLFFEGTDMLTVERARERYAQKTGARFEVLVRTKSGAERWIEADVQALHDPRGEVEGYIAVHRDVTQQVRVREAMRISEREQRHADQELRRAAENLAVIAANVPGMIFQWRLDTDGRPRFLYASPGARDLYGVDPAELMADARTMSDFLVNPEENTLDYAAMLHSAATLTPWHAEHRLITADGELRWLEANAIPKRNPDGSTTWTGYVNDVTRRKLVEQELRVSEEKLRSLYDLSPLGIALSDGRGRFLQTNQAMEIITGYDRTELAGMSWWDSILDKDKEAQRERFEQLMRSGRFGPVEEELTRKDGARIPVQITGIRVTASDGTQLMWSMIEDIADRKRAEQRISFLAYHDPLTGLDNRLALRTRLSEALAAAAASRGRLALMMIDLDRFKTINDTLGHDAGDRVIAELARRIRAAVRETDIVARLGGDEFVVVLTSLDAGAPVDSVVQRIFAPLSGRFEVDGSTVHITVSAGVSVFPDDGSDGQTLLKRADIAMYAAKAGGRDTCEIYRSAMTQAADQRLALETELRDALAAGQLVVHYQPQMDTLTGRPVGVEALLRWQHPKRGLIPPALFIPIAEESRLIEPIGEWVLTAACRDMRAWLESGGEPLTVAVNLSPIQFACEDLAERVAAALAATGLPPKLLELEITESAAMSAPDLAARSLARLKQIGVSLAIDDFGTGHSSLARLKMFNVDRLKIDRSIVTDCTADAYDATLCRATIALGRALGLDVVAEGVETQEQWQFLAQEHCNSVQGYLFARPMPAAEAFQFLRATLAAPRLRAHPGGSRSGH